MKGNYCINTSDKQIATASFMDNNLTNEDCYEDDQCYVSLS